LGSPIRNSSKEQETIKLQAARNKGKRPQQKGTAKNNNKEQPTTRNNSKEFTNKEQHKRNPRTKEKQQTPPKAAPQFI
jgi:hypothetical protein